MERINLTDTIRTIAGELDKVTEFTDLFDACADMDELEEITELLTDFQKVIARITAK